VKKEKNLEVLRNGLKTELLVKSGEKCEQTWIWTGEKFYARNVKRRYSRSRAKRRPRKKRAKGRKKKAGVTLINKFLIRMRLEILGWWKRAKDVCVWWARQRVVQSSSFPLLLRECACVCLCDDACVCCAWKCNANVHCLCESVRASAGHLDGCICINATIRRSFAALRALLPNTRCTRHSHTHTLNPTAHTNTHGTNTLANAHTASAAERSSKK